MTHKYTLFDSVPLPENNPTQTHDANGMRSSLALSVGGLYDTLGSTTGRPDAKTLPVNGTYVGAVEYLVDETGDYLVDESGDYLIAGDAQTDVRSQVAAIRAKVRQRGSLWRVRLDDESVAEWKTARLLGVRQIITRDAPISAAEITLDFETMMTNWHAADASSASASVTASTPTALTVENAGDTIEDAVITVTRTSGTITGVLIQSTALGVSLYWTGSLGSGDVLTIDSGLKTVRKNSSDSYADFELYTGHTARGWLPITPGNQSLVFTLTGGAATCAIAYYNQVA